MAVKLPCDYMTKERLKSLSGECKTYRMNAPMSWKEFEEMPDDLKVMYIKSLRKKFSTPDAAIADMLGVDHTAFNSAIVQLKLHRGSIDIPDWDKDGFSSWRSKT